MRISILSLLLFGYAQANAAQLACWSLWDKAGSKPAFTATFQSNSRLENVRLLKNEGVFGPFDISDVTSIAQGLQITTNRSPYKGNQSFELTADGDIRVILPMDLRPDALKNTIIVGGNLPGNLAQRQNGVIEVAGRRHQSGGSIFIRMHCISRF